MLKTVTVLYYSLQDLQRIQAVVLHQLPMAPGGRIRLPDGFRSGKLLVAVIDGEVQVLDTIGDRFADLPLAANR